MIKTSIIYRWNRISRTFFEHGISRGMWHVCGQVLDVIRETLFRLYGRFLLRDGVTLRDTEVGRMYLDYRDRGVSRQLLQSGTREPLLVELLREQLRPGMIGFDIGANIGYYVLLEASIVGAGGKVVACEPVPGTVKLLQRNVNLHQYSCVTVLPAAVSDTPGTVTMQTSSSWNVARMIDVAAKEETKASTIPVRATTLDQVMEDLDLQRVDFIRIDVEGHEMAVTAGMRRLLSGNGPLKLFMEVHNNLLGNPDDVAAWLRSLMAHGLSAKAVTQHEQLIWVERDDELIERVLAQPRSCPHVFIERNP